MIKKNIKINFREKFEKFSEYWKPKVITELNDYQFKLAKIKDEFIYSFAWEPNCLAIWDNYAILHNPVNDFDGHRVMHRITIQ